MVDIKNILKKIETLDPIPVVIQQLIHCLGDATSSLRVVVELVERDPALTANLLKICNSSQMGLMCKVDSVQWAVSLLGVQQVAELVLTSGLSQNLNKAMKGYSLAKGELWTVSVASAKLAKTLAEQRGLKNPVLIYTAALIRDIGKVILHDHVAEKATEIHELVYHKGLSFLEAEKTCIGIDHSTLGGMVTRAWHFSPQLTFMIENHHLTNPEARKSPPTAAIYWADMVAMMVGIDIGADRLAYHLYEESFDAFCLSREELRALMLMYEGYLKGTQRLLSLN